MPVSLIMYIQLIMRVKCFFTYCTYVYQALTDLIRLFREIAAKPVDFI